MNTRSSCLRSACHSVWYTLLFPLLVLSLSLPTASDGRPLYPGQKFPVGEVPFAVAVGDLNSDGFPDLVTANSNSYDVSVLLGRGDGTFRPERRVVLVDPFPQAIAVADLNGDNLPDLITANRGWDPATVTILQGKRDGTFQLVQRAAVGLMPQAVAVADLNGDGVRDLVTANSGSGDVSVLLGRRNGTFRAEQCFGVGYSPCSVAVADVNTDGHRDLIVANRDRGDVSVLLGIGDGAFRTDSALW